ncbi:zinc ribbon domain-containing protein [uncultured Devosia sp.]|uniref:zinc ribbon domain-containing protein n=1 Tax=uncultured Devosia sp. TaxID=211434 RepID=UPI0035CB5EB3
MNEDARAPARKDINEDFVLRGAVVCADCEGSLTACWSKSKTGKKHPYYLCFTKGCQSYRKSIPRERIEGDFEALLQQMTPTQEVFEIVRAMFKQAWDTRLDQATQAAVTLKADIVRLDKQIDHLMDRIVEATSGSMITAYERRVA